MEIGFVGTATVVIILVYLARKYCIRFNDYWEKRGVPSLGGALPLLGHAVKIFWSCKTFTEFIEVVYRANKDRSMVGFYQFIEPKIMIQDPELIKKVLVSEFPKFHGNVMSVDEKIDPLLAKNPFFNSGEKWKEQRNRLTYALMSGKRLRVLCRSVARVCEKFTKYLGDKIEASEIGAYEVEAKELSNRFTGEVVARGAFGIEGDFFIDGSGPNSFRETVSGFMEPSLANVVMMTALFFAPFVKKIFSVRVLPARMDQFFRRVVHEMIVLRRKDGIPRDDFLQLMLDEGNNEDEAIDEERITASATSFFLDGYETSAVTLAFFAYQMAKNPRVQEKLRREIRAVLEKHEGEMSYESLREMTYMDQALNESMRLYPAAGFLVKKSNEAFKLVGQDGLECDIEPETEIILPLGAIYGDSKYWKNPDIYEPERFSEESKKTRPKTLFLPFSEGPRVCPGMRFATMQIKGAMATILKDFVIEISPRTMEPLRMKRASFLPSVQGGIWINLKPL